jgi:hypothetical protein
MFRRESRNPFDFGCNLMIKWVDCILCEDPCERHTKDESAEKRDFDDDLAQNFVGGPWSPI